MEEYLKKTGTYLILLSLQKSVLNDPQYNRHK